MGRGKTAELAERLAASVLAGRPSYARPPVDVEGLARELGVESIANARMLEDGRLEQRGGHTWMVIREDVWPTRRRFTVAHELGHLLLADASQEFVARRTLQGADREERFCDAFAASLLMPRAWVLERFRGEPEALGTAKALAESSRASLAASVLRLRELLDWNSSLLHWRRSERGWQLSSTAGLPRGVRVTSAKTTSLVLDQIGSSPADATAEIPLAVAGRPTQASMEISVRGRSAIALAALNCFESSRDRDPLLARLEHARWGL